MAEPGAVQRLPNEIITAIVEQLRPARYETLPAAHDTTKTLLSLMRASSITYATAAKLFGKHCVYIDCEDRTLRFARCLSLAASASSSPAARTSPFAYVSNIFLHSFLTGEERDEQEAVGNISSVEEPPTEHQNRDRSNSSGSTNSDSDSSDSSEYLGELSDLPVATAVHDIFLAVAPTLTRLVIDIPLRSLRPEGDKLGVRPVLRRGFEALVNLEEFVSVQDELFLTIEPIWPSPEPEVWSTCWPKLRRLALYNPDIAETFPWKDLAGLPQLEVVMFCRQDAPDDLDIKRHWIEATARGKAELQEEPVRPLVWLNVDLEVYLKKRTYRRHKAAWERIDPHGRIKVYNINVPIWEECESEKWVFWAPRDIVHSWVRSRALADTLWDPNTMDADTIPVD